MARVFYRRLAVPVAMVFFTVALAAPPPATLLLMPSPLFVMALVGIAVLAVTMPGAFPWSPLSRSLARANPPRTGLKHTLDPQMADARRAH